MTQGVKRWAEIVTRVTVFPTIRQVLVKFGDTKNTGFLGLKRLKALFPASSLHSKLFPSGQTSTLIRGTMT